MIVNGKAVKSNRYGVNVHRCHREAFSRGFCVINPRLLRTKTPAPGVLCAYVAVNGVKSNRYGLLAAECAGRLLVKQGGL